MAVVVAEPPPFIGMWHPTESFPGWGKAVEDEPENPFAIVGEAVEVDPEKKKENAILGPFHPYLYR